MKILLSSVVKKNTIMSDKLKYSLNSYAVWCLVGYLLMAFFNWDFNAGNWPVGFRFVYILFGPVLGVFIGIIIFLWDKFEEEFSK
jgi:hypothetical protein